MKTRDGYVTQEWKNFLDKFTLGNPDELKKHTITGDRAEYLLMQAFYAGFGACFGTMNNIVDDGSSEEVQCRKMARIMDELEAFSAWQRDIAKRQGFPTQRVEIGAGRDKP